MPKEDGPKGTARAYCFTINNPTSKPEEILRDAGRHNLFRYIIFQLEHGEKETPHYQGFIQFTNQTRWSSIKKLSEDFNRAHFEASRGSVDQNIAYCSKDEGRIGGPWTEGKPSSQGQRTDCSAVAAAVLAGKSVSEIANEYPDKFMAQHRGIIALRDVTVATTPRTENTELWIFYGESGTGKSHSAFAIGRELGGVTQPLFGVSGIWWDDYSGQPAVILDEFKCNLPLGLLKRLADQYEITLDRKGRGSCHFNSKVIIITTNLDPETFYRSEKVTEEERAALARRVTWQVRFNRNGPLRDLTVDFDNRKRPDLKDIKIPDWQ